MKEHSGTVAMTRLRHMLTDENQLLDDETMDSIRKDVEEVVSKYVDVEPDNVDIKIILREYKKKVLC